MTPRQPHAAVELPWLDVDADGVAGECGVAALTGKTAATAGHPVIAELQRAARRPGVGAGQIVAARNADRFFWFAPAPPRADAPLRGLAIDLAAFTVLIDRTAGDSGVTAAEMRTLFQLVAGAGPCEAAAADGVSFETKRAQVKSLCAKLGCTGQVDLVRRCMGLLVHLLHATAEAD